MKNECAKTRELSNPYEIWRTPDGSWEWKVLKKWQVDDNKPYARWFCGVKSPMTYGEHELGDVYVKDIKNFAVKVVQMDKDELLAKLYKYSEVLNDGQRWILFQVVEDIIKEEV